MPCSCKVEPKTNNQSTITLNQIAAATRRVWRNQEWLVVPVVMARSDVVMNGAVIPQEELFAPSWNGVPVTFGHPATDDGDFLSANSPEVLDDWGVGYIFGAAVDGVKLKGEAWISLELAEALRPGSIDALEGEDLEIDVSTGYFAVHQEAGDQLLHINLKPDHLAILFDIPGACSFEDGCGVRANQKEGFKMTDKVRAAVAALNKAMGGKDPHALQTNGEPQWIEALTLETNRRGSSDDFRQIVADLISSDDSPFVPEDMFGVTDMSIETLKALRDNFIAAGDSSPDGNNDAPKPGANQEGGNMPEDKIPAKEPEQNAQTPVLSDEDKAALAFARNQYDEHRKSLVAKIQANSSMTEDQLTAMDVPTLETIANGLKPSANYSVRGGKEPLAVNEGEAEADSTKSMVAPNIFAARNQKEGA